MLHKFTIKDRVEETTFHYDFEADTAGKSFGLMGIRATMKGSLGEEIDLGTVDMKSHSFPEDLSEKSINKFSEIIRSAV